MLPLYFFVAAFVFSLPLYFFTTLYFVVAGLVFYLSFYFFVAALFCFRHFSFFVAALVFFVVTLFCCRHFIFLFPLKQRRKYKVAKKKSGGKMINLQQKNMERLYMTLLGFRNSVVLLFYFVNVSHFSLQVEFLKFKSSLFLT